MLLTPSITLPSISNAVAAIFKEIQRMLRIFSSTDFTVQQQTTPDNRRCANHSEPPETRVSLYNSG